MMENNSTNVPQPSHPLAGGGQKYDALRAVAASAAAAQSDRKQLFTMNITATSEQEEQIEDEKKFLIDLIFKPNGAGFRLRHEQTQLLLDNIGEMLKKIETEE